MTALAISRSSEYYYRNVIFQVEHVLYSFPAHILSKHSIYFKKLFEEQFMSIKPQGSCDNHPICLQSKKREDFEMLLLFLSGHYLDPSVTAPQDVLVKVLHASDAFNVPAGRAFAIEQLGCHPDTNAAVLLGLACRYRVNDWIARSLRTLIYAEIASYEEDHVAIIDPGILYDIDEVKKDIQRSHLQLLTSPPINHYDSCTTKWLCQQRWTKVWRESAIPLLMQDQPLTCVAFHGVIERGRSGALCDGCLKTTTEVCLEMVRKEEQRVTAAIVAIGEKCGFTRDEIDSAEWSVATSLERL